MLRSNSFLFCSSSSSFSSKIRSPLQARRKWEENLSDFLTERNQSRSEVLASRYRDIYVNKDFTPVQEVFPEKTAYESKKWGTSSKPSQAQYQRQPRPTTTNASTQEEQSQKPISNMNEVKSDQKTQNQKRRMEFMANQKEKNGVATNEPASIYLRSQQIENPHVVRVALVGPTNAGKSTLLNTLVASHVSAESRRPGTTVDWVRGVTHVHDTQIQILDTPGIFLPKKKGTKTFSRQLPLTLAAWDSLFFANVVLFANPVSGAGFIEQGRREVLWELARRCKARELPIVLALTKIDLIGREKQEMLYRHLRADIDSLGINFAETCEVSAAAYKGVVDLKDTLASFGVPGAWEFPKAEITGGSMNLSDRVEETLREVFFQMLPHGIPHEMTHKVVGWTVGDDRNGNKITKIIVEVFFDRPAFMHEFFKHQMHVAQRARERCKVVLKQNVWFHFQAFVSPTGKNRV